MIELFELWDESQFVETPNEVISELIDDDYDEMLSMEIDFEESLIDDYCLNYEF